MKTYKELKLSIIMYLSEQDVIRTSGEGTTTDNYDEWIDKVLGGN